MKNVQGMKNFKGNRTVEDYMGNWLNKINEFAGKVQNKINEFAGKVQNEIDDFAVIC